MRASHQHYGAVVCNLEVVVAGVGQTGLTPTVAIQRLSDNQWLQAGAGSWGAGFATNNMVEIDAANNKGLYAYAIPNARLTYAGGLSGYRVKYVEATNSVLEYEHISCASGVDVQQWIAVTPNALNSGAVQVDLQRWLNVVPNNLNSGAVQVDVQRWVNVVPNGLVGNDVPANLKQWKGAVPLNLAVSGRVESDVHEWNGSPVNALVAGRVPTDLQTWLGVAPLALTAQRVEANVGAMSAGVANALVDLVWDEDLTAHQTAGTAGYYLPRSIYDVLATATVVSTTGTTTTLDAGATATANYYAGARLGIVSGTGVGQERVIQGYSGARVAAHAAWTTNPDGTSKVGIVGARSVSSSDMGLIADAVWDEPMSGHAILGSGGDNLRRMLGLRQSNTRVVYDAWTTGGSPTHGTVYIYDSKADCEADVTPFPLASGKYEINGAYDTSNRLTEYVSTREA